MRNAMLVAHLLSTIQKNDVKSSWITTQKIAKVLYHPRKTSELGLSKAWKTVPENAVPSVSRPATRVDFGPLIKWYPRFMD
jgi:hypothetical protein